jgi:SAM-dependent methyltransferase
MANLGRWYQNAIINGKAMPAQRRRDTSQRRWKVLLEPLIPPDGKGRLFLELGCNAGFYLRKASEYGYNTLGIEKEERFIRQAKYWEAQEPCGVRVEFGDIVDYEIPANFLTMMANVHYWIEPVRLAMVMDRMWNNSLHVLIMSRHNPSERHLSDCTERVVKEWFSNYELLDERRDSKFYALIYRNPTLREYDTKNLFNVQPFTRSTKFLAAFREFIDLNVSRRRYTYNHTKYWEYCKWRGWQPKVKHHRTLRKKVLTMERYGITKPLLVHKNGILQDGNHRLIMAEYLGLPRIICKVVD